MNDLFVLKRWAVIIVDGEQLYLTKDNIKQFDFIVDVKINRKNLLEALRSLSVYLYKVNRKNNLSDLILIANMYNLIFTK